jgi:hypothetical protein
MKENRRRNCNEFPGELGIWVPRDLSVRDASNTNKKKVQVNLKLVVG